MEKASFECRVEVVALRWNDAQWLKWTGTWMNRVPRAPILLSETVLEPKCYCNLPEPGSTVFAEKVEVAHYIHSVV